MAAPFPFTLVASIVRTRGLRGEVICELLTDFPEKFEERKRLFLLTAADAEAERSDCVREITLEKFWMPTGKSAGRVVLKFAGFDSIEEAQKLAGMMVAISSTERAALEPDSYYASDLEGCQIVTANGSIGRVASVDMASTGSALLVVRDLEGREILIPLVKAYLVSVDLASKRIEMQLPDGLVEVNLRESGPTAQG